MRDSFCRSLLCGVVSLFLLCAGSVQVRAQEYQPNDPIRIYLVRVSPGKELYSVLGHAAIRVELPSVGKDFIFSYESEGSGGQLYRYMLGKLKGGVKSYRLSAFLHEYEQAERQVYACRLKVSREEAKRIWHQLQALEMKGMCDTFDIFRNGCAAYCRRFLVSVLDSTPDFHPYPVKFDGTLRQICNEYVSRIPGVEWQHIMANFICPPLVDDEKLPKEEKVVIPQDWVEAFMRAGRVDGEEKLISQPAHQK